MNLHYETVSPLLIDVLQKLSKSSVFQNFVLSVVHA